MRKEEGSASYKIPMNKHMLTALLLFLMLFVAPAKAEAATAKVSVATATIAGSILDATLPQEAKDTRIAQLQGYLETRKSPLAQSAKHFIAEADRLGLDWRLVAAIAGNESYFGKLIPRNSNNAWGWAVYTGMTDGRHFTDWNEGITVVSEGLKHNYIDSGLVTIDQIGRRYAADPGWSSKVKHFIAAITAYQPGVDTDDIKFTL